MFGPDELFAFVAMAFSLLVLLVIGGFILLFPIARRLGAVMEEWLRLRQERGRIDAAELEELRQIRGLAADLSDRVERLDERQRFLESVLEKGEGEGLPAREP